MNFAMTNRRILKNGELVGTRLIKLDEKSLIVDICDETKNIREKALQMESRIEAAIARASSSAARSATQKATLEVLTRYSDQQSIISAAVERISKQLIDTVVDALNVTLTTEQKAQILGKTMLTELSNASLPVMAIRVNPALIGEFESWLNGFCPETLRSKVQIFPHDNIPTDCVVVRADSYVTELSLRPMIASLARNAAASIALDLGIDMQPSMQ